MKKDETREPFFYPGFVAGMGGLSLIVAVYGLLLGVLGLQAFWWLRDGVWTPLPIGAFVGPPAVAWGGLRAIVAWLWDCSIAVPLALAGVVLFVAVVRKGGK